MFPPARFCSAFFPVSLDLTRMTQVAAILLATASAGVLAGAHATTFLCAACAAAAATWLCRPVGPLSSHDFFATLDPQRPVSTHLLEALREALSLVQSTRKSASLRLSAFTPCGRPVFRLDVNRTGDLELFCDNRRTALKMPGIWLPDHPLPLILPHARCITLLLEPCGTERIRASLADAVVRHPCPWPTIVLGVIVACSLDTSGLLAATLGFAFQSYLLHHQAHRAADNPYVESH